MKKKLLVLIVVLALPAVAAMPAFAGAEEPISCTVTPEVVAVSVTDGSVAYGFVPVGTSTDTLTLTAEQQTISNAGNVQVNISLKSSDATGTSVTWELVASADSDRPEEFAHQYDIDAATSPGWSDFEVNNDYGATVVTLDPPGGTDPDATLDLKVHMPTETADTSEHTIAVTVRAIKS